MSADAILIATALVAGFSLIAIVLSASVSRATRVLADTLVACTEPLRTKRLNVEVQVDGRQIARAVTRHFMGGSADRPPDGSDASGAA